MAESESDKDATKTQRVMVQTYDDGYRAGYQAGRAQAAEVYARCLRRLQAPQLLRRWKKPQTPSSPWSPAMKTPEEIARGIAHHFRWLDRKGRVDLTNTIAAAIRTEREARVKAEAEARIYKRLIDGDNLDRGSLFIGLLTRAEKAEALADDMERSWRMRGERVDVAEARAEKAEAERDEARLDLQNADFKISRLEDGTELRSVTNAYHATLKRAEAAEAEVARLREALERVVEAKLARSLDALVAGWNGVGRPDGPYERHWPALLCTLPTCCGDVYELTDALAIARAALTPSPERSDG